MKSSKPGHGYWDVIAGSGAAAGHCGDPVATGDRRWPLSNDEGTKKKAERLPRLHFTLPGRRGSAAFHGRVI